MNNLPIVIKIIISYLFLITFLFAGFVLFMLWLIFFSGKDIAGSGFFFAALLMIIFIALPFFLIFLYGTILLMRRKRLGWIILTTLMAIGVFISIMIVLSQPRNEPTSPWFFANFLASLLVLIGLILNKKVFV